MKKKKKQKKENSGNWFFDAALDFFLLFFVPRVQYQGDIKSLVPFLFHALVFLFLKGEKIRAMIIVKPFFFHGGKEISLHGR